VGGRIIFIAHIRNVMVPILQIKTVKLGNFHIWGQIYGVQIGERIFLGTSALGTAYSELDGPVTYKFGIESSSFFISCRVAHGIWREYSFMGLFSFVCMLCTILFVFPIQFVSTSANYVSNLAEGCSYALTGSFPSHM